MAKTHTKRALLTSVISLLVCFTMLVGTTFAWFTDSVTSSGNIIKSGTLDVTMGWAEGEDAVPAQDGTWTDAATSHLFDYDLWEPGYTVARHVKIENVGTLALKYQLRIVADGEVTDLADVIDVYYADPAVQVATRADVTGLTKLGTLTDVLANMASPESTAQGRLVAGAADMVTLVLSMQTTAGNEYQNKSIGSTFSIQLIATQDTVEADSFDNQYDADSKYPMVAGGSATRVVGGTTTINAIDPTDVRYDNNGDPYYRTEATVHVPDEAWADDAPAEPELTLTEITAEEAGYTTKAGADQASKFFNIHLPGIKEGNTAPIPVEVNIGTGLSGVEFYHKGEYVPGVSYSKDTGIAKFTVYNFSPFELVNDLIYTEVEVEAPTVDNKPALSLEKLDPAAEIFDWKGYGGLNPESDAQTLEVVYKFSAVDTSESVKTSPYKDWFVDFVVSIEGLNRDLVEGEIALGGHYGSFGWVGFVNPAVSKDDVSAGIPLLQAFTGREDNSGWTYADIVNLVGEFKCGAALALNAEGNLVTSAEGLTFVVELVLTSPDGSASISYDAVKHVLGSSN